MQDVFIGFTSVLRQRQLVAAFWSCTSSAAVPLFGLAINKEYEPTLLLPIGFGAILVNLPLSIAGTPTVPGYDTGFLQILYNMGIQTELFPLLIFIAVGAMISTSGLCSKIPS